MPTNLRRVTVEELTAVADEIRSKGSTASPLYWPDGFIQAIEDIEGGGDVNWKNEYTGFLAGVAAEIPDTAQNLRNYALAYYAGLTAAMVAALPEGLKALGDYCLAYNTSIQQMNLSGKSLETLGNYCFTGCTALQSLNLSDNDLQTLGTHLMDDCSALTTLNISGNEHLETIPAYFAYHVPLTSISVSGCPIKTIGDYAFASNHRTRRTPFAWIEGLATLKDIGTYAFYSVDLSNNYTLDLSGTAVENIGESAFESAPQGGITGLTSIIFPASLVSIGRKAFYANPARTIDFSRCTALVSIGNNAFAVSSGYDVDIDFSNCSSLQTLGIGVFFGDSSHVHKIKTLKMPSHKLTSIGTNCFRATTLANQSTIDNGEMTIRAGSLGANCFTACTGIKKLNLEFDSTDISPFSGCTGITEIHMLNTPTTFPANITSYPVFQNCTGVTDIYVPWAQGAIAENRFFTSAQNPTWHYNVTP